MPHSAHLGTAGRVRHIAATGLGDIGQCPDIQRIRRQQFFMVSVMQSALRQGLLGDPLPLLSVAYAVTLYLTTDPGFGLSAMYDLARSMRAAKMLAKSS